jgi:hypothetical protein
MWAKLGIMLDELAVKLGITEEVIICITRFRNMAGMRSIIR